MAYRLISRLYFHLPVLFVFFYVNDLSLPWIATALGAYAVVLMVASGLGPRLAGRWGERRVLVLAELVKALCLVVLAVSPTPAGAVVGEVVAGLGFTLSAGTDTLLMRKVYGDGFNRLQAQTQGYMFLSLLGAGAVGGLLFTWDDRLPLYASIVPALIGGVLVGMVALGGVPSDASGGDAAPEPAEKAAVGPTRPVWQWIGFYALERGVLLGAFVGLMPYYFFTDLELGVGYFGIVLGCFTLAGFLSARYADRIGTLLPGRSSIVVAAAVTAVGLVLFAVFDLLILSLASLVVLGAATGIIRPLTLKNLYQAPLDPATVPVVLSRMEQLFGTVNAVVVIAGVVLLDQFAVRSIMVALALFLLASMGVLVAVSRTAAVETELAVARPDV